MRRWKREAESILLGVRSREHRAAPPPLPRVLATLARFSWLWEHDGERY